MYASLASLENIQIITKKRRKEKKKLRNPNDL